MKKMALLLFVVLFNCPAVFAYQIVANDRVTYEYESGIPQKGSIPQSWLYEVDEEKGIIKILKAVATHKGATVDVAEGYEAGYFQILSNEDGNMVAMKLIGRGLEFIEFRNDGTYTAYMSAHIPKLAGVTVDVDGDYVVLAFGEYSVKR